MDDLLLEIPFEGDVSTGTSSSDDSDLEYFDYIEQKQAVLSLANAVKFDFIRKVSERSNNIKSPNCNPLNSFASVSKSWSEESKLNFPDSGTLSEKSSLKKDTTMFQNGQEKFSLLPNRNEKKENVEKHKVQEKCYLTAHKKGFGFNFIKNERQEKILLPRPSESPKNALLLYWGRVNMTVKELRRLNLSRCINTLLEDDHYEFVLLKMQDVKFTLQFCSMLDEIPAAEEKTWKTKRKKSLIGAFRSNSREEKAKEEKNQLIREKHGGKSSFFSCVGFSSSPAKYQQLLQHNDSLCLKAYEAMRKKKVVEFDYRKTVYCGVEEKNIPNNMLLWVYYTEYGSYSAVECHCAECDDQSHARLLSRALKSEIIKANRL